MTRRQHQNSVSLFPFLAVLVCAMGSLILLLLVMTRKIRHDQQIEAESPPETIIAAAPDPPDRSAELQDLQEQIDRLESDLKHLGAQQAALQQSLDNRSLRTRELSDELDALRSELGEKNPAPLSVSLDQSRKELSDLETEKAVLRAQLSEREQELLRKRELLAQAQQAEETATRALHEKHSALVSLRTQVEQAQQDVKSADGTKTLIEFSNPSGTARLPLVIDVSGKGYELLPNGPRITVEEMQGFPIRDNPLLAAVLAEHRYRSGNSITEEPYVLLLVRPDGCLPFYGAQRILTDAHIHMGYELLDADRRIVVEAADPAEVPVVNAAIADALRRREQLYSKLLAMAQSLPNPDGTGPGSSPEGSGPNERRLSVRRDGRVISEERTNAVPLEGRFYAGGVAPSAAHLRHRPAGGYGAPDRSRLSTADAEKLADEFAERYARQLEAARSESAANALQAQLADATGGSGPDASDSNSLPGNGQEDFSMTGSSPAPNSGGQDAVVSEFIAQEALVANRDAVGSHPSDPAAVSAEPVWPVGAVENPARASDSEADRNFVPMTPEEAFLMRNSGAAPRTNQSTAITGPSQGTGSGPGESDAGTGNLSGDLSRVDPKLLAQLPKPERTSHSLSTPVGISVFLDETHLTVNQQPAVEISADRMDSALATLLSGITAEVDDARPDPREPMLPIVKFIVSPGGERWRIPLARELKSIGIPVVTVYELTPWILTADDTGRAHVKGPEQ